MKHVVVEEGMFVTYRVGKKMYKLESKQSTHALLFISRVDTKLVVNRFYFRRINAYELDRRPSKKSSLNEILA